MKRLAIYAHFGEGPKIALHVFHCLREIRSLGFEICFVSNSPVSVESQAELAKLCQRLIQRENTGLDFSMWQAGLAEYDLSRVDELLLTNSSIIGPLKPLSSLWQHPSISDCDFWGLTDSCDISPHLQSYFLVFRRAVIGSEAFARFWASVLPYDDKAQIIRSYEIGLTSWFAQQGFKWRPVFPHTQIWKAFLEYGGQKSLPPRWRCILERLLRKWLFFRQNPKFPQEYIWHQYVGSGDLNRRAARYYWMFGLPGLDTTLFYPRILVTAGMPFLKARLLKPENPYLPARDAYALLEGTLIPRDALGELQPSDYALGSAIKRA